MPGIDDHMWRCGCTAREQDAHCTLIACVDHEALNRPRWARGMRSVEEQRTVRG